MPSPRKHYVYSLAFCPGPVEEAEGIEMLRFLEHSYAVAMVRVEDAGMAVDTPEDLKLAESHSLSSHWGTRLAGNAASE